MNDNDNKAYKALIEAGESLVNRLDSGSTDIDKSYAEIRQALKMVQDGVLYDTWKDESRNISLADLQNQKDYYSIRKEACIKNRSLKDAYENETREGVIIHLIALLNNKSK